MSLLHALCLISLLLSSTCSVLEARRRERRPRGPFEVLEHRAATGPVFARRAGPRDAPRMILVHGTPGSAQAWDGYLRSPPPGWELVAVDRPGFGASAPAGAVTSLAVQAAALAPLLRTRSGVAPILVGHSLGAAVVLRAAIDYPERVGGVVLLAGSVDPDLEELRWYNLVAIPLEWALGRSLRNANREIVHLKPELQALARDLEGLRCPALVLHGTADALVPHGNVDFLRSRLPGSLRVLTLQGSDHFFLWTERERVERALADFARQIRSPGENLESDRSR